MRVLFHITARRWSGSVRAFALAAHGLSARRWETTLACPPGSEVDLIAGYALTRFAQAVSGPEADVLRRVLTELEEE